MAPAAKERELLRATGELDLPTRHLIPSRDCSHSPLATRLPLHSSPLRDQRLERSQTRLGVHVSVPGELQDQALKEGDQQARHRIGIERSWEFAACLCALNHSPEYRLWHFHTITNGHRESTIVEAFCPYLHSETAPCPLIRGAKCGNEIRRELIHGFRKALFFQCPLQQSSFTAMALLDHRNNDVPLAGKMTIDRAGA